MKIIISLIATTCLLISQSAYSHIEIESDTASYDQRLQQATHEGSVVLKQDNHVLKADKLVIERNKQGQLGCLTATGNPATFRGQLKNHQAPIYASAKKIQYFPDKQLLILEGNAILNHQLDQFKGPILNYDIEKQMVNASKQNNERPTLFIHPRTTS